MDEFYIVMGIPVIAGNNLHLNPNCISSLLFLEFPSPPFNILFCFVLFCFSYERYKNRPMPLDKRRSGGADDEDN